MKVVMNDSIKSENSELDFQSSVKLWDDPQRAIDILSREAFVGRIAHALNHWRKDESEGSRGLGKEGE